MKINLPIAVSMTGLLLTSGEAWTHHAFSAEFDINKPVKLEGKVTRMEWINPHSWIHIEVTSDDGAPVAWMVEAGTPNHMYRRGFTRESLPAGTVVSVEGYQARDGSNKMAGNSVTFADGRRLFVGGSSPE